MAVVPLLGFWLYGLFDLDEGFYAAVVSSMLRTGDWITPHYRGAPWFEKPILLYWAAAPFVYVFKSDWAVRLPSVLATLGTCWCASAALRRHVGEPAARWGIAVLGTSFLVAALGRMMMTDALLVLSLSAAFLAHWEARDGDAKWRLATAAFLGLGVLAKGPVALLLFGPVAVVTCWREPELRRGFARGWIPAAVVFAAVVGCWYVPAYLASGQEFVQEFLIEQNLQRFAGGDAAHAAPLWSWPIYYPLVLLVGMAPWSFLTFRALPLRRESTPFERYLFVWFVVILGFFTVGGSKLPHYILPAAVPLAMLVAIRLGRERVAGPGWGSWATSLIVAALLNGGFLFYYSLGHAEVHALARLIPAHQRVSVYQMPRRTKGFGTGKPEIQETSHPSLEFYLDQVLIESETLDEIAGAAPGWVITRTGRLSAKDLASLPPPLITVDKTPVGVRHYRLYLVYPYDP